MAESDSPDVMEDLHDGLDIMDLSYEMLEFLLEGMRRSGDVPRHIPFTRKQDLTNVTQEVKNRRGTKIAMNIDLINNHQRFWRSHEGEVTIATDQTFLQFSHFEAPPHVHIKYELDLDIERDAKILWSPIKRHSHIRWFLSFFNLGAVSPDELTQLENHLSLCLLNAVSTANGEGYTAFDFDVFLEVATVDTYDEEEVLLAKSVTPASRYSIEALPSQEFNNGDSSEKCAICLNAFSRGVTVTQLPCSHDFHRQCIEKWLNINNSCPICRSSI